MSIEKDIDPTLLETSLNGCVYDLANVVHAFYHNKYVCAKVKTRYWFMFNGVNWIFSEIGPYHDISTHLVKVYENFLQESKNTPREVEISRLILKLKNVHFKENLLKECLYKFYKTDFLSKLDRNKNLVCFRNGVLDISERTFREGRPDDYISLYIDMDYSNTDLTRRLHEFMEFRDDILMKRKNHIVLFHT